MGNPNASDVAREASDIILLDDQFGSIVKAVEEGRRVFDNLKKSICYTITHLPVECLPIFLNSAFGLPSALGGILTLTIDLIAEQGNATSMVFEKAEDNIMTRPPRNYKTDRLVPTKLLVYAYCIAAIAEMICCFLSYSTVFWYYNVPFSLLYESQFKGIFGQSDNNPIDGYP